MKAARKSKTSAKKPPAPKRKAKAQKPKPVEFSSSGKSTKPKMSKYGFLTSSHYKGSM